MLNIGLKMETVFKIIKRNQYIVFVSLLILIHFLLNNYPDYEITGFNILTYKYLFVSLFSISIFIGLFYIVKTYYKKLDKVFYYTFFVYFTVLFIYSLLFYPAGFTVDAIWTIIGIEHLTIFHPYLTGTLVYSVFLWLTSTLYVVTFFQIVLISFTFAYFMSFCSNFISLKFLFFINLFFILNPIFYQYCIIFHQNIPTNYLILFLGFFLFKAFIENVLLKKQSIFMVCILNFLIALSRSEAIIIPFATFFIYVIYLHQYKLFISINHKIKIVFFLLITILFILFIKYYNPFNNKKGDYSYKGLLYETNITYIMSSSKFSNHNNISLDSKISEYYNSFDNFTEFKKDNDIYQFVGKMDVAQYEKQKELAISLILNYPFIYLEKQVRLFKFANLQEFFVGNEWNNELTLTRYWSKKEYPPKRPVIGQDTYTKKYNIGFMYKNMLYVGFIILLTSILLYRYNPYTALISILFLSSKALVFISAWEGYFMQYLVMYYAIPIIPLMACIEMKKRKN